MKTSRILVLSLIHLLCGILVGILLLGLVYCIPVGRIEQNVRKSALNTIKIEGLYPELTHAATSYLDNWTDSIMLAEASHPNGNSPFIDAMQVVRYVANEYPDQSLVSWAETGEYSYESPYPQYWHGYLVLLKPLLTFMDYAGIRVLNGSCQVLMAVLISITLWCRGKKQFIVPWLLSYAMLMPAALAKSLQFSSCYYVFSLAAVTLLCRKKESTPFLIFLWAGIMTAYFDFLTYPISTFGIPALFYLLLQPKRDNKSLFRELGLLFLVWAVGYGLMWGGKLLAGSLITGADLIHEAEGHVGHWFDGERWFSVGYVFYFNVRDFVYTPVSFLAFGFVLYAFIKLFKERKLNAGSVSLCVPFVVISLLPFAWYLFLFNPSGIHHFFTNKACVVCAFGGMSMMAKLQEQSYTQKI